MRIYISADIEGVAGVVSGLQGNPSSGGGQYERARRYMADEVNAAIRGAFNAGATQVVVNDGHGPNTNLQPDLLDPRAELISGKPKSLNMVQGIDEGFDGIMFVGYHARPGTEASVLDHAYLGSVSYEIRLNGRPMGELGLNALMAGHVSVPVLLVTGDDKVQLEAQDLMPGVGTTVVKWSYGRNAARNLSPAESCQRIEAAARRVVAGAGAQPCLFAPPTGPLTLEIDFLRSGQADVAALLPGSRRTGGRTVLYPSADYREIFQVCRVMLLLGSTGDA